VKRYFKIKQKKGLVTILQTEFFLSEARRLGPHVCLLLATLIESSIRNEDTSFLHWRDGLLLVRAQKLLSTTWR